MNKYSKHIYKKIKEYETIVIVRHQNSDMDALGSQFAIKEWINLNFPNKKVYCLGENHQKYTKKGFIPKSDSFTQNESFLGICVDVNSLNRIDGNDIFEKASYKICIDHHSYIENNEFDYVYINKNMIACCQVIAQLFFDMKKKMNTQICKYLYAGICSDSGNFYYSGTNYLTLEIASKLLKIGNFNQYTDIHRIVNMDSINDLKVSNYMFSKLNLDDTGFAFYVNSIEDLKNLGITAASANETIADFNKVEEIAIVLAASECEDHTYRCSLRSKEISIVEIAQRYGGGGHKLACGVKGLDKEKLDKMIVDLKNLLS
jgi:nanoRNase/pAp phosphatase (c-di-AMP/oligoRNAs hydrolase)